MRRQTVVLVGTTKDGMMAFGPFPSTLHAQRWIVEQQRGEVVHRFEVLALCEPVLKKAAA